jgi:mannose-6-phosphate isomerase-like protein (cupin superfamily)
MRKPVSPHQVAASLVELWSPRIIADVDDYCVKVARVHGVFGWHCHENEDELFLVLRGCLTIDMDAGAVTLTEGELYVVPKGVRHNPSAQAECLVMLIESRSTLHAGNTMNEKAHSLADQLRPI